MVEASALTRTSIRSISLRSRPDNWEDRDCPVRTQLLRDDSQSIISYNNSPDVGFNTSLNPYRGCEHGCAYCYARPTHEYLGLSADLDFESKILVKPKAAELLRAETDQAQLETATSWVKRHHRCIPTDRTKAQDYPFLP